MSRLTSWYREPLVLSQPNVETSSQLVPPRIDLNQRFVICVLIQVDDGLRCKLEPRQQERRYNTPKSNRRTSAPAFSNAAGNRSRTNGSCPGTTSLRSPASLVSTS